MPTILTKKKDTAGAPAPGDLTNSAGGAELAVNTFDKRLYTKNAGGSVVEIGTNPSTIDTTTVDTTNLEVTNIKAKDGTASATIANSTGVMTVASSVLTTTDINGGTIDNTAIGGSTAAAGNFTTLGASGATTFTAGTASTSTTTGTAVITGGLGVSGRINAANFDGIVGANTAAAGNFTTLGATGVATFSAGTVSAPAITTTGDTNTGIFFPAADTIAFTEGGVESMRITSTGIVDIGGSSGGSVGELLVVEGANSAGHRAARINNTSTTNGYSTLWMGSSNDGLIRGGSTASSFTDQLLLLTSGSIPISFYTANTERMRIDSAGNVGIGTSSPSTYGKFAVLGTSGNVVSNTVNTSATSGDTAQNIITANTTTLTTAVNANGNVTSYTNGAFYASGTTSSAPQLFVTSNTERMRISSDGYVLIGTTSNVTGAPLQVNTALSIKQSNVYGLFGGDPSASVSPTTYYGMFYNGTANAVQIEALSGGVAWRDVCLAVRGGSVGIGTNSPLNFGGTNLHVENSTIGSIVWSNGTFVGQLLASASAEVSIGSRSNHPLRFGTNDTERMRITSGGILIVGGTTATSPGGVGTSRLQVISSLNDGAWVQTIQSSGASVNRGLAIQYSGATPNDGFNEAMYFTDATAARFILKSNGGIDNYSGNNTNLSDVREKNNIELAGNYLDKICAIPVKTFNYIDQNRETDDGLTLGVIAQDVQAVAPELVTESDWGTKDKPKIRLSIYQTDLQYALMKCIQEQQALIENLTTRLNALEGK